MSNLSKPYTFLQRCFSWFITFLLKNLHIDFIYYVVLIFFPRVSYISTVLTLFHILSPETPPVHLYSLSDYDLYFLVFTASYIHTYACVHAHEHGHTHIYTNMHIRTYKLFNPFTVAQIYLHLELATWCQ